MVAHNEVFMDMATIGDKTYKIVDTRDYIGSRNRPGNETRRWANAPSPFNIPKEGWPTQAPPGTVEKALVMASRANRQEDLFHAYDARWEGDIRPLLFYLEVCEKREAKRTKKVN